MSVLRIIRDACPHCEAMRDIEVHRERESMKIRGEDVEFESEFMVCATCEKDFAALDQLDHDIEAARAVYRARHGIISPKEIVAMRSRYDVSQKSFAKLLDIGDLTINSYEQGVIPSGAHNSLLRLVSIPENFLRLYSAHKDKLSDRQKAKIERALARLSVQANAAQEVGELAPIYSSDIESDRNRLFMVMQLLLASVGEALYKMAIIKLLFYVDFSYYRKARHSVSGWRYARLPYGPVPDDYKELLCKGEESGLFISTMDAEELGERFSLPEDFDVDRVKSEFSPSELEVVELVVEKLGHRSASELSVMTHEEKAWLETAPATIISWDYAFSLKHGV